MKLETRVYGWLLRAYPKAFRLEFGQEMLQVFKLQFENAQLEKRTLLFWISTVFDCVSSVIREQFFRKSESMNWWQKLGGLSSFVVACTCFTLSISNLLRNPGRAMPDFLETFFAINFLICFPLILIGVFRALPSQKNRLEWFGIFIICSDLLLGILCYFLGILYPQIGEYLSYIFLVSLLAISLARVKINQHGLLWSEIPNVSRALIFMLLSSWLAINVHSFIDPFYRVFNGRGDIISPIFMALGFVTLALGIWHSKPSQPSTPNLISS